MSMLDDWIGFRDLCSCDLCDDKHTGAGANIYNTLKLDHFWPTGLARNSVTQCSTLDSALVLFAIEPADERNFDDDVLRPTTRPRNRALRALSAMAVVWATVRVNSYLHEKAGYVFLFCCLVCVTIFFVRSDTCATAKAMLSRCTPLRHRHWGW